MNEGEFRTRQLNDRAAALDAKYDPDDEIAARRLGVPIEAGTFLKNFMKKGKSMGGSEGAMGGEV